MFTPFLTALIYEISRFLSKHPNFFDAKKEEREKVLENLRIPTPFKHYLSELGSATFMREFVEMVHLAGGSENIKLAHNGFFKALVVFFTETFSAKFDALSNAYYLAPMDQRRQVVDQLISGETQVAQALRDLLVSYTYQDIATEIHEFCRKVADAPYLLVQSPREVSPELKKEIRKQLLDEFPGSFPIFQINRNLIGGLRFFKNGISEDYSWLSRVLQYTSLMSA